MNIIQLLMLARTFDELDTLSFDIVNIQCISKHPKWLVWWIEDRLR